MSAKTFGMWIWGGVTTAISTWILFILALAASYMCAKGDGFIDGTPHFVAGTYYVLKDCGTLVGGVLGFSGLAWAHFFQAKTKSKLNTTVGEIS